MRRPCSFLSSSYPSSLPLPSFILQVYAQTGDLLSTPPIDASCRLFLLAPPVDASYRHLMSTPPVGTFCRRNQVTPQSIPRVNGPRRRLKLMSHVDTSDRCLRSKSSVEHLSMPPVDTSCQRLLFTLFCRHRRLLSIFSVDVS